MEFYLTNAERRDLSILPDDAELDLEIGKGSKNDFVVTIPARLYDQSIYMTGGYLYSNGTEYGGLFGDLESNTASRTATLTGDTWRGILETSIVEPPKGSDYLTVSGDVHEVIRQLIGARFGDLFNVEGTAGVSLTYQVNRYVTVLSAIEGMLASVGMRLRIAADGSGEVLCVLLSAQPIVDHSDEVETSQDTEVNFRIKLKRRRYTHMICAGKGDLAARTIVYLHQWSDGRVERVSSIPAGLGIRTYFYDYPNAADVNELVTHGTEQFSKINKTDSQEVMVDGEDVLEIGDIVGGRDYVTGITVKQKITQKIVKVDSGRLSIDYKIGG